MLSIILKFTLYFGSAADRRLNIDLTLPLDYKVKTFLLETRSLLPDEAS